MELWELETKLVAGNVASVACMLSSTDDFLTLYWEMYVYMLFFLCFYIYIYLFGEPRTFVYLHCYFFRALVKMFLNNAVNIYITKVCKKNYFEV